VDIPLVNYPQLGDLHLDFHLYINNENWTTVANANLQEEWAFLGNGTNIAPANYLTGGIEVDQTTCPQLPEIDPVQNSDGSTHPITILKEPNCNALGGHTMTTDGTGILDTTDRNGVVYGKDGYPIAQDLHGNTITVNGLMFTDSIGRQIPLPPFASPVASPPPQGGDATYCTGSLPIQYTVTWKAPGPNGGSSTYKMCYVLIAVASAFNHPGIVDGTVGASENYVFLQSLVLPNLKAYTFEYQPSSGDPSGINYGDISKITLPTGGSISYEYASIPQCAYSASLLGAGGIPSRHILSKTIEPGDGTTHLWKYSWPQSVNACLVSNLTPFINVVVTDPYNNDTVHWYVDDADNLTGNSPWGYLNHLSQDPSPAQMEVKVQYYQGSYTSGTLLKTVTKDWSTAANGGNPINGASFPVRETSIYPNGSESKIEHSYDSNLPGQFYPDTNTSSPASYGNVIEDRMFDFGSSAPGGLLKKIDYSYHAFANIGFSTAYTSGTPSYLLANLTRLMDGATTYDGLGNKVGVLLANFDENNGSPQGILGNTTSKGQWLNSTGNNVMATSVYNTKGMVTASYDANGNKSAIAYGSTGLYPSSIQRPAINGISHIDYFSYDSNTGNILSHTDQNGSASGDLAHTTTYTYNDLLGRLTNIVDPPAPNGKGETTIGYSDTLLTVTTTVTATPDPNETASRKYDGIGRAVQSTALNGATTETTYDLLDRIASTSNPHFITPSSTDGLTTYSYDAMGRMLYQCQPDNGTGSGSCVPGSSYLQSSYAGNTTTTTDEAGNVSQRTVDALGRLTKVLEPNGILKSASMETDYTYDGLNNLLSVKQWGGPNGSPASNGPINRSFSYDSLSRLIQSFNPETGWVCYGTTGGAVPNGSNCTGGYDANSNLTAKTDGRGITTAYTYDALNRLTNKTYSDGSGAVAYGFDASSVSFSNGTTSTSKILGNTVGRLSWECQLNSAQNFCVSLNAFSYDPMGRVSQKWSSTPSFATTGSVYGTSALYDLAGDTTSLTYPDGRLVTQGFDSAARLNSVIYSSFNGNSVNKTLLTVNTYDPIGHPTKSTFGNGVIATSSYNPRSELASLAYANPSGSLWNKQFTWTTNGNLQFASDMLSGITRQYGYDTLNRLASAQDIVGTQGGSSATGQTSDSSDQNQSNLLEDSQALGSAGWNYANVTMVTNATDAPDGSMTAGTMTGTAGSASSLVQDLVQYPALYDNISITGSVWLRARGGAQNVSLSVPASYETGTTTLQSTVASTTAAVTPSWQLFHLSGVTPNAMRVLSLTIGGSGSVVGGQTIDIWGPTLQVSTPTTDETNILPYSQQWNSLSWTRETSSISSSTVTAPDGTGTAFEVTASSSTIDSWANDAVLSPSAYSSTPVTGSIYLRAPSGTPTVHLSMMNTGQSGSTVLQSIPVTLSTTWQRFQVTGTTQTLTTALQLQVTGGSLSWSNGQAVDIWGAQIEATSASGQAAGQYVATLDTPVTVTADNTNGLPSSTQLTGSGWSISSGTTVANTTAVVAPDGSNTADIVTAGTSPAVLTDIAGNPALYDGATVTGSVYLSVPVGTALNGVNVSLSNVNSSGSTASSTQMVNLTRDWTRVQVTGTNQNGLANLYLQIGGGSSFPAGQVIYVWGAEMVMGSAAGPPVQTTNTTTEDGTTGTTVSMAANGLNESYSYDAFGNMQKTGNFNFVQGYSANNRLSGWAYDPSGNLLNDGVNSYTYDAEGRISGLNMNANLYVYDAESQRVSNGATGTDHVLFGGREIARYAGGQWTDLIYGTGALLAEVPGTQSGSAVYRMTDHLGSPVGTLNASGVLLSATDYTPFGQVFTGGTADPYQFTGKERDTESGNDYFGARYYASSMGRFSSPDPSGLFFADPTNPQSLNLYSYVYNNPLINIDPSGMECVWDDGSYDAADDKGTGSADKCSGQGGTWIPPSIFEGVEGNQPGSWSGQASSSVASDWLNPSVVVNTPNDAPSLDQIKSMIVAGSIDDFFKWLPCNGKQNCYPGAQYPLTDFWKYALGGLSGKNNYCGPNGAGDPLSTNDWACAVHDYNYRQISGIGKGNSFFSNPSDSVLTTPLLRQADANLATHVFGAQGLAIKSVVAAGAANTWAHNLF
jgi:RHS repeat-associated protein